MSPSASAALSLMGWLAPLLFCGIGFLLARSGAFANRTSRSASSALPASAKFTGGERAGDKRLKAGSMRGELGRLPVRLVTCEADVERFGSELLSQHENAMVTRPQPMNVPFPFYLVAIPDDGLSFDLRPIAFDPRSQFADIEARIMSAATSLPAQGAPAEDQAPLSRARARL